MTELIKKKFAIATNAPKFVARSGKMSETLKNCGKKLGSGCGFERAIRSPRWIFWNRTRSQGKENVRELKGARQNVGPGYGLG